MKVDNLKEWKMYRIEGYGKKNWTARVTYRQSVGSMYLFQQVEEPGRNQCQNGMFICPNSALLTVACVERHITEIDGYASRVDPSKVINS